MLRLQQFVRSCSFLMLDMFANSGDSRCKLMIRSRLRVKQG